MRHRVARARLRLSFVLGGALASAALPIGHAYVVPRIGSGRGARVVVVVDRDRRVWLRFAPWPVAVTRMWSFRPLPRSASSGRASESDLAAAISAVTTSGGFGLLSIVGLAIT